MMEGESVGRGRRWKGSVLEKVDDEEDGVGRCIW